MNSSVIRSLLLALVVVAAAAGGYFLGQRAPSAGSKTPSPPLEPPESKPEAASEPDVVTTDVQFNPDFVKVATPTQKMVPDQIPITGKLSLDAQQVRISAARVAGRLGRIFVFEGQSVSTGTVLAELYAPDYISAENEYLLAKGFRDQFGKADAGTDTELRGDSEATFQAAANKLKVLGASETDVAELKRKGVAAEYLNIRAPISGVVTKRMVDPGAYLNIGDTLMTLANVDQLWLFANTYEPDYAALKIGETLEFQTAALPGRAFHGSIAFIAPSLDAATHTLAIRCDVPNPEGLLRPEMFISGNLQIAEHMGLVIPRQSVFHIKESDYVFVREAPRRYRRIAVTGRPAGLDDFAVTAGLPDSATVVTDGGVLLNQMLGEQ